MNYIKIQVWTYDDPVTAKQYSFTLVNQVSTWAEAKDACTARGARLVQPDSHGKHIFLIEKLRTAEAFSNSGAWFGASRNPQEVSQWLYTDGSEVVFTKWKSGRHILFNSLTLIGLVAYFQTENQQCCMCLG